MEGALSTSILRMSVSQKIKPIAQKRVHIDCRSHLECGIIRMFNLFAQLPIIIVPVGFTEERLDCMLTLYM